MNKFTNPKKRQEDNIATINEVFSDLIDEFDAILIQRFYFH